MRGSIVKRYENSWSLVLDLGYRPHAITGKRKRTQKWITFRGTKKQAEAKLNQLLTEADSGTFVDPSKLTLGQWLVEWFKAAKSRFRASTVTRYEGIITDSILRAPLASMLLQKVRPIDIEQYYASLTVSASTASLHHVILHGAFRKAARDRMIVSNPARDLEGKPRRSINHAAADAERHCWSRDECRRFLQAAKEAGTQPHAFYALALDAGLRKGELCALAWSAVDLNAGTVRIERTLLSAGPKPVFGPTKTGKPRTVVLSAETIDLLRIHRAEQRKLKLASASYNDLGLTFAKQFPDLKRGRHRLGDPVQYNNFAQREFAALMKAAGIRPIKFHGLRHSCATLLLGSGQALHVVAARLGHADPMTTLRTYAHALPSQQRAVAEQMGALLHG